MKEDSGTREGNGDAERSAERGSMVGGVILAL